MLTALNGYWETERPREYFPQRRAHHATTATSSVGRRIQLRSRGNSTAIHPETITKTVTTAVSRVLVLSLAVRVGKYLGASAAQEKKIEDMAVGQKNLLGI
jgi:hypothetical protein